VKQPDQICSKRKLKDENMKKEEGNTEKEDGDKEAEAY